MAQDAAAAMQEALQEAAVHFTGSSSSSSTLSTDPSSCPGSHQQAAARGSRQGGNLEDSGSSSSSTSSSGSSGQDSLFSNSEGGAVIASLNTVAERGVTLQVRGVQGTRLAAVIPGSCHSHSNNHDAVTHQGSRPCQAPICYCCAAPGSLLLCSSRLIRTPGHTTQWLQHGPFTVCAHKVPPH